MGIGISPNLLVFFCYSYGTKILPFETSVSLMLLLYQGGDMSFCWEGIVDQIHTYIYIFTYICTVGQFGRLTYHKDAFENICL